ncbi:SCP-like protein [Oesophagostomum dentatum]|uniref:SCP-like protein n=1 Tax=Oesophagostomum dentatum TaxID=61180 RepID=A0A0B1T3D0_OESDE|nr:SCP-like protein [Oesophagostomum dentatum]
MDDFIRLAFLSKHNALRTTLALGTATNGNTGNNARSAVNMPQLVYDCGLESAAYERAKLCESFTPESPNTLKENSFNYTHRERTFQKAAQLATQFWWSELKKSEGLEQIQNIFYTHLGINHFAKVSFFRICKYDCRYWWNTRRR